MTGYGRSGTTEVFNKTLCNLCGKETPYIAMGKCALCWEMEKGLRMLTEKDKSKAIKWLEDNLKELKGK